MGESKKIFKRERGNRFLREVWENIRDIDGDPDPFLDANNLDSNDFKLLVNQQLGELIEKFDQLCSYWHIDEDEIGISRDEMVALVEAMTSDIDDAEHVVDHGPRNHEEANAYVTAMVGTVVATAFTRGVRVGWSGHSRRAMENGIAGKL